MELQTSHQAHHWQCGTLDWVPRDAGLGAMMQVLSMIAHSSQLPSTGTSNNIDKNPRSSPQRGRLWETIFNHPSPNACKPHTYADACQVNQPQPIVVYSLQKGNLNDNTQLMTMNNGSESTSSTSVVLIPVSFSNPPHF
ncbi:hypothetical protein llap_2672 [Limosa lapponica baueri]|uniref:Uncharacterized protein n=1 Tax=Limosa lapponica baueri TaxID=1758121 RepID=A0A2I0ULV6_LIMLA|nr:hypothetical protein llap_2672 [Limosa lapponica baueri]